MDEWLLLINVGPVQGFIATARRSRDLWFGSWWLSELSREAAQTIAKQCTGQALIFPAPESDRDLDSASKYRVVNKILARVSVEPRTLAADVRTAIDMRLEKMRKEAFQNLKPTQLATYDIALEQIRDLPEFFWAALPLPSEDDYPQVRDRLESLIAARKVTRTFHKTDWGSSAPKSSLDGLRESVIPQKMYAQQRRDPPDERQRKIKELYRWFRAAPAEQLSGVDLLKRLGNPGMEAAFPSTSHVTAAPLLARLAQRAEAVTPLWNVYAQELRKAGIELEKVARPYDRTSKVLGGVDASILFEERLFEDQPRDLLDQNLVRRTREKLRAFLQAAADVAHPLPYYAILLADGDGMGKTIDAQRTSANHRALSTKLDAFAEAVRDIVETQHEGALIFAGGDDVLAFLPLHTALACAKKLHEEFGTSLESFTYDEDGREARPTLSVGIAVSHHIEPLSDALALARAAERAAKEVAGKNALAVTVSKRSGSDRTIRGPWGELDQQLDWLIGLHRIEAIPSGAGYELEEMARRLAVPRDDPAFDTLQQAAQLESVRILRRKKVPGGNERIQKEHLDKLAASIKRQTITPTEQDGSSVDLAQTLIVAHLFAEALDLANGRGGVSSR